MSQTVQLAAPEVRRHHIGDRRVDRLRIFPCSQNHTYAIVNSDAEETLELIGFQSGAVCDSGVNGITDEVLLAIVLDRLVGFQFGPMECEENRTALEHVSKALDALLDRRRRRLKAGIEGRSKPLPDSRPSESIPSSSPTTCGATLSTAWSTPSSTSCRTCPSAARSTVNTICSARRRWA